MDKQEITMQWQKHGKGDKYSIDPHPQPKKIGRAQFIGVAILTCLSVYLCILRFTTLANSMYNAARRPSDPVEAMLRAAPLMGMLPPDYHYFTPHLHTSRYT